MTLTPPGRQSGRRGRLTLWHVRDTLVFSGIWPTLQTFSWAQGLGWICEYKCSCLKEHKPFRVLKMLKKLTSGEGFYGSTSNQRCSPKKTSFLLHFVPIFLCTLMVDATGLDVVKSQSCTLQSRQGNYGDQWAAESFFSYSNILFLIQTVCDENKPAILWKGVVKM